MELQWPLILFTTLVAWSAGLFGTQALLALRDDGKKAQMPALIASMVLLVAGGISVFFHLQHWERIFNGFGHITSGITQELIAIVVMVVLAVVYFAFLRKSEEGGSVPKWLAICSLVIAVLLVVVMAHSYMMAARPAWNSLLWVLYVLGNACVFGPVTMAIIMAVRDDGANAVGVVALVGAIVNAITSVVYALVLQMSGTAFVNVGLYFDPTHPNKAMVDPTVITNVFAGPNAPLMWLGVLLIGGLAPLVAIFFAKKKADVASWKMWGGIALAAALVGALCMRVVFYNLGLSMFLFY